MEDSLHEAQANGELDLPAGYALQAVGSFQNQIEANQRLMWVVPLVILTNLFIIYLQFRHLPITLAVFAGIPVAFAGGMVMLAVNGVQMNTAVWIGFIALFGIAVDDGVVGRDLPGPSLHTEAAQNHRRHSGSHCRSGSTTHPSPA